MNYLSKVYLTVLAPVTLLTAGLSYASAALAGDIFTPRSHPDDYDVDIVFVHDP